MMDALLWELLEGVLLSAAIALVVMLILCIVDMIWE